MDVAVQVVVSQLELVYFLYHCETTAAAAFVLTENSSLATDRLEQKQNSTNFTLSSGFKLLSQNKKGIQLNK